MILINEINFACQETNQTNRAIDDQFRSLPRNRENGYVRKSRLTKPVFTPTGFTTSLLLAKYLWNKKIDDKT